MLRANDKYNFNASHQFVAMLNVGHIYMLEHYELLNVSVPEGLL